MAASSERVPLHLQTLNTPFAEFFARLSAYPIVVTIQPNLRWTRNRAHNPDADAHEAWGLLQQLFYRLDRLYTGCPRPDYLSPTDRFNGIAVMEKHGVNPHLHVLLSCENFEDQLFRSLFLLEMLDNVVKQRRDERDQQWQVDAWKCLMMRDGWAKDLTWSRESTVLTDLAPAGTAMVQVVRSAEDRADVCAYITKTWRGSMASLDARRRVCALKEDFDFRELREFFSKRGITDPARFWKIDPEDGRTAILDLDDPNPWRRARGRIKP